MKKQWQKAGAALIVIVLSPLLLLFFLGALLIDRAKEPQRRREYEASRYYRDFRIPYFPGVLYGGAYRLYQEIGDAEADFELVPETAERAGYVRSHGAWYLFPDDGFDGIFYDDLENAWMIGLDGDWSLLDEKWQAYRAQYTDIAPGEEAFLMVLTAELLPRRGNRRGKAADRAVPRLPSYVKVGDSYRDILKIP